MWIASEAGDGMLARRKHWRSHRLPDEPGDKCTVMHDLQELSGHVRAESRERAAKQDRFWDSVRRRLGRLDLRDNERLCAITFVKRMFPKVAAGELGLGIDESHWPSTVYVGAAPWIRRVLCTAPQQARHYAGTILKSAGDVIAERRPPFRGLQVNEAGDFPRLDANYFHREFVKSERLCPLDDNAASGLREELAQLLEAIYQSEDDSNRQLGPPPSFHALLLADGDRLGRLVGELGGQSVGQALADLHRQGPGDRARARWRHDLCGRRRRACDAARAAGALLRGRPVALLRVRVCGHGYGGQGDAFPRRSRSPMSDCRSTQ